MLTQDSYKEGFLDLNQDNLWEFVVRDRDGNTTHKTDIRDIQYTWKMQMQENTFSIGWNEDYNQHVIGSARHYLPET